MMKSLPQRGARTAANAKKKTSKAAAGAKPDFMDVNKNGNRKESMKAALASKSKGKTK
jgi:hypothetical protein